MRLRKPKLAAPRQRLAARAIDLVLQSAPLVALAIVVAVYQDTAAVTEISVEVARRVSLLLGLLVAWMIIHLIQWILIGSRGQSIGKILLKLQIVDAEKYDHAGIVRTLLLRTWLSGILMYNLLYFVVDSLLVLREDRRAIHDFIAGTTVITQK